MGKVVRHTGYCPTLKSEHSVDIEYLETTTLADGYRTYIKSLMDCKHAGFGNCPIANECPINAKAPQKI